MRKLTRLKHNVVKSKSGKNQVIVVISDDCDSCDEAKDKGMCKDSECIDIFSKEGKELDKQIKIDYFPFCVVKTSSGKIRPCTEKELDKAISE